MTSSNNVFYYQTFNYQESFARKVNKLVLKLYGVVISLQHQESRTNWWKQEGALKAPDFEVINKTLIKTDVIWTIFNKSDANWKFIPTETFDRYGGALFLHLRQSIKLLNLGNLYQRFTQIVANLQEIHNNVKLDLNVTTTAKKIICQDRRILINHNTVTVLVRNGTSQRGS